MNESTINPMTEQTSSFGFFTPNVGVLALQGDFEKHINSLKRINIPAFEIRSVNDLNEVDALIIPGGESTTVGKLMNRYGLDVAITERAKNGMPVWGTCMGMIVLTKNIQNAQVDQQSLDLLDITVKRNAYGRQIDSFETDLIFKPINNTVRAVFIRAPIVLSVGPSVEVLSTFEDKIVAVKQGNILGSSFHPELTDDTRVHEYFVSLIKKK